jgi:hypothetical protein
VEQVFFGYLFWRGSLMKSKYLMALMCAFCFGVLGKTALDAASSMDSYELRRDREFRGAVEAIAGEMIEAQTHDLIDSRQARNMIESLVPDIIESLVPDMIEDALRYCNVYVDGDYGSLSC